MSDLSSVLRRIKKLLAIAEDTRANPNEAAAASQQATKLMAHYQIEHSDVIATELKNPTADTFNYFDVQASTSLKSKTPSPWAGRLAVGIAKYNGAQARYVKDLIFGTMIRFEGFGPDVQVCRFTYKYILNAMAKHKTQPAGFYDGFVTAVNEQLQKAPPPLSSSTALVIVKGDAIAKHFGEVNYKKASVNSGSNGFNHGYTEGTKLNAKLRALASTESASTRSIR